MAKNSTPRRINNPAVLKIQIPRKEPNELGFLMLP